jgi:hypothetical protein
LDDGGVVLRSAFVIAHGASASVDPRQRHFHDPTPREDLEADLSGEFRHDHDVRPNAAATSVRVPLYPLSAQVSRTLR